MRTLYVLMFTVVVFCLSVIPARAQQTTEGATWGVSGGYGIGYGTIPKNTTRKMEPSFNGGVFFVTPFAGPFKFQPEVKYDHRTITVGGIPTKVDYFSVPLLIRNEFFGIYMTQGVALNWIMRATVFDVDFKKALTSPDVAIVLSVGKQAGRVAVEGRWDTGMRSFQHDISKAGVHARALTGVVSIFLKQP